MSLQSVFHRPLRAVVAGLWLTGALIAGFTAPLAAARLSPLASLAFALPALGLVLLAVATFRGVRWALVLSLVLLGAQVFGVVGSAWELSHQVDASKASELHALGFDPQTRRRPEPAVLGGRGWSVRLGGLPHPHAAGLNI